MTKFFVALAFFAFAFSATAETKIFKVGNMDCEDCAAQLRDQVCKTGDYQTCDIRIINKKKEIGRIKLVTKGDAKVDMVKVANVIENGGYNILKK